MQFGIGLPNLSYVDPTETLIRLAHAAQELAFDAIWVSDHVFIPYAYAPNYPYSATGRLGLTGHGPYLRSPHHAGVSRRPGPYTPSGDQCLDHPLPQPDHHQMANLGFYPKPVQKPHPPLWIGGYTKAALRRAVRLGDGWHPSDLPPADLAAKAAILRQLCVEAGRDPASLTLSTRVNNVAFGDSGDTTGCPTPISGTPQQMIDTIERYEDAGVQHIVLGIRGRDAETMLTTARRFVDEVRPKV
jgi:alkanesulfonate monooxygenase SsuD/methylene tetrahydromethanopterin reductase-like flavin-dependent oxidoreductase (luciferase family)